MDFPTFDGREVFPIDPFTRFLVEFYVKTVTSSYTKELKKTTINNPENHYMRNGYNDRNLDGKMEKNSNRTVVHHPIIIKIISFKEIIILFFRRRAKRTTRRRE